MINESTSSLLSVFLDVLDVIDDIMNDFDFNTDLDLSSISPHDSAYSSTSFDQADAYGDMKDELYTTLPSLASNLYKSPVTTDPMLSSVDQSSPQHIIATSTQSIIQPITPQIIYAQQITPLQSPQLILPAQATPTAPIKKSSQTKPVQLLKSKPLQSVSPRITSTPVQLQPMPAQVISLQGVNGNKQLLFQTNPTVMYTTANGTPVSTNGQNVQHTLVNGTLTLTTTRIPVVLEADNKVPISRIVPKVKEVIKVITVLANLKQRSIIILIHIRITGEAFSP